MGPKALMCVENAGGEFVRHLQLIHYAAQQILELSNYQCHTCHGLSDPIRYSFPTGIPAVKRAFRLPADYPWGVYYWRTLL